MTSIAEQIAALQPPPPHDDLCVWWDNVGKEPLDYTCTCGAIEKTRRYERARLALAVELLENIAVNGLTGTNESSIFAALPKLREGL